MGAAAALVPTPRARSLESLEAFSLGLVIDDSGRRRPGLKLGHQSDFESRPGEERWLLSGCVFGVMTVRGAENEKRMLEF